MRRNWPWMQGGCLSAQPGRRGGRRPSLVRAAPTARRHRCASHWQCSVRACSCIPAAGQPLKQTAACCNCAAAALPVQTQCVGAVRVWSLRSARIPICSTTALAAAPQIINGGKPFLPVDALQRGTSNFGSGQRMERLGQKLLAGQPVTVTFLGGSITWGRVRIMASGAGGWQSTRQSAWGTPCRVAVAVGVHMRTGTVAGAAALWCPSSSIAVRCTNALRDAGWIFCHARM